MKLSKKFIWLWLRRIVIAIGVTVLIDSFNYIRLGDSEFWIFAATLAALSLFTEE